MADIHTGTWLITDLRDDEQALVYYADSVRAIILKFSAIRDGSSLSSGWIQNYCFPVVDGLTYFKEEVKVIMELDELAGIIFGSSAVWTRLDDHKHDVHGVPEKIRSHIDKIDPRANLSQRLIHLLLRGFISHMQEDGPVEPDQLAPNDEKVPATSKSIGTCGICREDVYPEQPLTVCHKCKNSTHSLCLVTWLKKSTQCPLCRANYAST